MQQTAAATVTSATLESFIEDLRGGEVCERKSRKTLARQIIRREQPLVGRSS